MQLAKAYQTGFDQARGLIARYREHLSAGSMAAGFVSDNWLFGRADLPNTQAILAGYLALAAIGIVLLHAAEAHPGAGLINRWRNLFPMAIQFALGSMWSGLLVLYSRSAVFAASWPFLALLAAIFIGNELFHRYVARLVFSTTLLFFALFSFAVMIVPVYVHAIGTGVFLLSGALALGLFIAFTHALARMGAPGFGSARLQIFAGAAAVFAVINLAYFTGILPPLPLALMNSGVYHSVTRNGSQFTAEAEPQPWYTRLGGILGLTPAVHLAPGAPVSVEAAVFAPVKLSTRIRHRWQFYSPRKSAWVTKSVTAFTMNGGRDGGYRGYSTKHNPADGEWRVNIETEGGRLIGRIRFTISHDGPPAALETVELH